MDNQNNVIAKYDNHLKHSDYRVDLPPSSSDSSAYKECPTRVAVCFMEMFQSIEREKNKLNCLQEKRNNLFQRLTKLRCEVEEQKRSYHEEMTSIRKKLKEVVNLDENDDLESKSESDGFEGNNNKINKSSDLEKKTDFVEAAKKQAIKKELSQIMKEIVKDHPGYKF